MTSRLSSPGEEAKVLRALPAVCVATDQLEAFSFQRGRLSPNPQAPVSGTATGSSFWGTPFRGCVFWALVWAVWRPHYVPHRHEPCIRKESKTSKGVRGACNPNYLQFVGLYQSLGGNYCKAVGNWGYTYSSNHFRDSSST